MSRTTQELNLRARIRETRANMTEEQRLDLVRKAASRVRIDGGSFIVDRNGQTIGSSSKAKDPERVRRAAVRARQRMLEEAG
jgi:hypothetical protein